MREDEVSCWARWSLAPKKDSGEVKEQKTINDEEIRTKRVVFLRGGEAWF